MGYRQSAIDYGWRRDCNLVGYILDDFVVPLFRVINSFGIHQFVFLSLFHSPAHSRSFALLRFFSFVSAVTPFRLFSVFHFRPV